MKRLFSFIAAILLMVFAVSCTCSSNNAQPALGDSNEVANLVVENVISLDRQAMYLKAADDYRWFETGVVLKDWLDEENDGSIEMVVNVFQTVIERGNGFDTMVYKFQHTVEGTVEDNIHGFWMEDNPLNDEAIVLTFEQAFERVMAVNMPKPHTKQVVLRKQVGPVDCNPQWIFGNARAQIYVDAVTGDVTDKNPAFGSLNLGTPLGEWP